MWRGLKLIKRDLKRGVIKLQPESLDDLWHLYNIISRGDELYAKTRREIKTEEEGARPTKGKRIPLFLGIRVEKVALQKEVNRLRVTGVIFETPEEFGIKGSYHTISISVGKPITIKKSKWLEHDLKRIKSACEERVSPIVVVAIDDEECCIAILHHYGFDVKTEIRTRLPGKLETERRGEAMLSFFDSAIEGLYAAWKESRSLIVVVGPGFIKSEFVKHVRRRMPKMAPQITSVGTVSSGGIAGVNEALRSGILSKASKRIRATEETRLVEEVLARLGAEKMDVSYGLSAVKRATNYGAVETLLVADKLLRDSSDEEMVELENLIRDIEKMRGKVIIVSTEHEAGKKLYSLGGVAALLRFPMA